LTERGGTARRRVQVTKVMRICNNRINNRIRLKLVEQL
jgi:hypothetical protein